MKYSRSLSSDEFEEEIVNAIINNAIVEIVNSSVKQLLNNIVNETALDVMDGWCHWRDCGWSGWENYWKCWGNQRKEETHIIYNIWFMIMNI